MPIKKIEKKHIPIPVLKKDMGGHWQVFYPELFDQLMEEYWYAVELIDSEPKKAEKLLKNFITVTNGLHFDAVQHLGYLYNETGKAIEGNP